MKLKMRGVLPFHSEVDFKIPRTRVLLEKLVVTQLIKSFIEPEGSLPCSQELVTGLSYAR
jgi:hypothetical protein